MEAARHRGREVRFPALPMNFSFRSTESIRAKRDGRLSAACEYLVKGTGLVGGLRSAVLSRSYHTCFTTKSSKLPGIAAFHQTAAEPVSKVY